MLKSALNVAHVLQRFAFPLFAGLAIGLMVLSRVETPAVARLRAEAVDLLAPVIGVMSQPIAAVHDAADSVRQFLNVYEDNQRLRAENRRLLAWQAAARQLDAENREFRALLSTVTEPRSTFVTARIISMAGGAFVHTAIIDAGRHDGVAAGQAVVTSAGMIGRIVEVGDHSARILLLTDLNSRIPVVVDTSRARAVLAGDNSDTLSLIFVAEGAKIAVGDRLVTSGEGGLLPPGLPVGAVIGQRNGVWRVQPFVDPARVEYVRVLDYALPGLMPETREAGTAGKLW